MALKAARKKHTIEMYEYESKLEFLIGENQELDHKL